MEVVAINGSPKGKDGNTYMLLSQLEKGIKNANGVFEILNLVEFNVNECLGCYNCWKCDGKCIHTDDMNLLINKIIKADIIIFATPVYCHNITILMKKFLERFLIMLSNVSLYMNENNEYIHTANCEIPPLVILSSCNLNEYSNFDTVSTYFKSVAKHLTTKIIAEIFRTQIPVLKMEGKVQKIISEAYVKTLVQAGTELAMERCILKKTEMNLKRRLVDPKFYVDYLNENITNGIFELC